MKKTNSQTTRIAEYITKMLPWAHGHQLKAIMAVVLAIVETQTANQAEIARSFGNKEAAVRRVGRLIHNERVGPKIIAEAVLSQALAQLPERTKVRIAIDWTVERTRHLLVVSLVMGHRAVPIYWRAYDEKVLKGRMRRYEMAVIKRVLTRMLAVVERHRIFVTADRGFADVVLFDLLSQFNVQFIIRVKGSTKVEWKGEWRKLNSFGFQRNERRRNLGHLAYCEGDPHRLYITMSRACLSDKMA